MRILSWNINGIRTLPHYHPWSTLKTLEAILPELHADIICFQEMKTSRKDLDRQTAIPQPYHSFFSFPKTKGGYSGVSVYCDPTAAVAAKAEEGLSGVIQPKPPLSPEDRISRCYPSAPRLPLHGDDDSRLPSDLAALDAEGRALVLDFGLFVLINVYCPNDASDVRMTFKTHFNIMLQERVRILISEGREVIVLGDINIASNPIDHSEGSLESKQKVFWDHPPRVWLKNWLEPVGPMHDVIRRFWPDRQGMYTCWNTKISARDTNYGARIDYIFVTTGLLPWIKGGDIQASVRGSDHCPIYIDLHDEIKLPSGETSSLREALGGGMDEQGNPRRDAPRLAAKYWAEYSTKQTLLHNFFNKPAIPISSTQSPCASPFILVEREPSATPLLSHSSSYHSHDSTKNVRPSSPSTPPIVPSKRKISSSLSSRASVGSVTIPDSKKLKPGQATLSSFFLRPSSSPAASSSQNLKSFKATRPTMPTTSSTRVSLQASQPTCHTHSDSDPTDTPSYPSPPAIDEHLESDYVYALSLSEAPPSPPSAPSNSDDKSKANTAAWAKMLAPLKPPRCTVHGEPTKEFKVNKPGPNQHKRFFICSRPVGPGYDAGKSRRLREEVDPRYRCDFFKWASDVRREQRQRPTSNTTANEYSVSEQASALNP